MEAKLAKTEELVDEVQRMAPRYFQNTVFLIKAVSRDAAAVFRRSNQDHKSDILP